jgi:signal peptidase I
MAQLLLDLAAASDALATSKERTGSKRNVTCRWPQGWACSALACAVLASGCGTGGASSTAVGKALPTGGARLSGPKRVYRIPSGPMEPTVPIRSSVAVQSGAPAYGAIVLAHPSEGVVTQQCGPVPHMVFAGRSACEEPVPKESDLVVISRVVAVPGDEIYIYGGHVFRRAEGTTSFVRERDAYIRACGRGQGCNFPRPIRVPAGHWYLMGDNRGESNDSRFWGPVPTTWIQGVAVSVTRPRA